MTGIAQPADLSPLGLDRYYHPMRHAMIMAGGTGTRLWPMSRARLPKQLIPFIDGRSLLQVATARLQDLLPPEHCYICAAQQYQDLIIESIPGISPDRYLAEPVGRDTLNAAGWGAIEISRHDPDAIIAVFTADHIIEPIDRFQQVVTQGFELAESRPNALVTFGVKPTRPATAYGYLQLGEPIKRGFVVEQFKEKPDSDRAKKYFEAGSDRYLWNSGMFVWRARTLVECIRNYAPENAAGLARIAQAVTPDERLRVVDEVYPRLPKVSVDFGVMEPASRDPQITVAAVPMPVSWLDVGSWPAYGQTCPTDEYGNALGAAKHLLLDSSNVLVATSDPDHLITTIGCEDIIIVHSPDATLVCRADRAEDIKRLHGTVRAKFGDEVT